ncbi:MAG: Uncharacterised protein [Flavobacterium sp. SCGC AAA160-P02]|nr:MAG: Uncharacterised protein [Flavobacterium sp. SCGC AAA160-P02]
MKIHTNNQYTLVNIEESSFDEFEERFSRFNTNHLLLQLSKNVKIIDENISLFLKISTSLKAKDMSFVLIKPGVDFDDFPETLNIVPSIQEAKDILEMEAIERDLGI